MAVNLERISRPEIIGPGKWHAAHTLAAYADKYNQQDAYIGYIRYDSKRFPCKRCRSHFIDNLVKLPPEKFVGQEYGMSRHSFKLHNMVNKQLGKKPMSWETYKMIYLNNDEETVVCENCGNDNPIKKRSDDNKNNVPPTSFERLRLAASKDPGIVRIRTASRFSNQPQFITVAGEY